MVEKGLDKDFDDENWATKAGIYFTTATLEDVEELKLFLLEHYYQDEPIARCIGTATGNSWSDKYARHLDYKDLVVNPIKQNVATVPCSIIARSTVDMSIVGCRMGAMYDRKTKIMESFVPDILSSLPSWIRIPHKLIRYANLQALNRDLRYSKENAFEELKDSGDVIYIANALSVSRKRRGEGIGAEMLKRAYRIALESGCKYTYVLATGIYSQKLFQKLGGVRVLHEKKYEDYRLDRMGRAFLSDTKEHQVAQVLAVNHNEVVM